jgi:hypothetical protein
MASTGGDGPPSAIFPGGTDAQGNIFFAPPGAMGRTDSTQLMRVDARGAGARAVGRIKTPDVERQESGGEDARQIRIRPIPLSTSDGWAVNARGDVAIVRSGAYRVEWYTAAGGAARSGAPVHVQRARIGDAEKKEWVNQQMLSGGVSMQVEDDNGRRSVSFGRRRPSQAPSTDGYRWPASKPPFDATSVRIDATGRIWVRRYRPAGEPPMYDVFGADGNRIGGVTFPAGRVLLGFGARALFAALIDDDGQHTLERYALPL